LVVARALTALGLLAGHNGHEADLEDLALVRRVAAGRMVFARDERARCAVLLAQGRVALGIEHAGARFEVERTVQAPAWVDLASVWLGGSRALDARAITDSVVVDLPLAPLRQHLAQQPAAALRVIESLSRALHDLAAQTSGLMHSSAAARLARWLRDHAAAAGGEPGHSIVRLNERKRDLASQLAIAPETLSRLLRRFAHEGVIDVAGYSLRILDREALEGLSRW
jgi:CRP-like cAMP-binding protein